MKAYETTGTVGPDGIIKLEAPPEFANQQVDVFIVPKRPPAAERVAAWERLCRQIQSLPHVEKISEDDIQREIDAVRSGQ